MRVTANAKINLTLDITGVRPDGFHTLRSVMAPISLCDEIELTEIESGILFDCNIKELVTPDNLCVKAAKLFFETIGKEPSISIYLEKNIPFPAGLGGGSADAAAVLRGLNELYGNEIDEKTMFELASKLGSDVPLCLSNRISLCEGRGEILTPITTSHCFNIVIAIGKARLSTPEVYRKYDAMGLDVCNDTDELLVSLKDGDFDKIVSSFGNAFEPVTDILAPETMQIRSRMMQLGALNSHLSGSGPSVYGVFESAEIANDVAKILQNEGYFAVSCVTLN
ncbi:MAG: 4-(cytidine 5'-diphospho)-2-C-methyl-D-erythritol kinase [Clostridia bacterium]|nr:4-(cytidine 5'-diphospho)-2-C-methyl-D-erythritol kinase [Clostridia bacterium]